MGGLEGGDCRCAIEGAVQREIWGTMPGPWQTEPDRVDFEHAGMVCILHRGPSGHWCGYVACPPGHPCHGKDYHEVVEGFKVDVHGDLTYANPCGGHICHTPKPGAPDDVWWLGFDCGHYMDKSPMDEWYAAKFGRPHSPGGQHYWMIDQVRAETMRLAEQLAAIA